MHLLINIGQNNPKKFQAWELLKKDPILISQYIPALVSLWALVTAPTFRWRKREGCLDSQNSRCSPYEFKPYVEYMDVKFHLLAMLLMQFELCGSQVIPQKLKDSYIIHLGEEYGTSYGWTLRDTSYGTTWLHVTSKNQPDIPHYNTGFDGVQ